MDICDKEVIWVDYPNIVNVLEVGSNIYIDDGLICLVVTVKGEWFSSLIFY